jgi:hypothetical protein
MKQLIKKCGWLPVVFAGLLLGGCLVSGTFVVVEVFSFNQLSGDFYSEAVDLTDDDTWNDHKDEIDRIDVVGFELWVTNESTSDFTFNAYLDDPTDPMWDTEGEVVANATLIFDNLTIEGAGAGSGSRRVVSYSQSFGYLKNIPEIRRLVKEGIFDYYALIDGTATGSVDSVKVIVTVSASN